MKIKDCPFCGSKCFDIPVGRLYQIECPVCSACSGRFPYVRKAIKAWNKRASKNVTDAQQQGKVMKHELVAVHANGEGWGLQVEVDGNSVAEIPWPKGWPIFVDGGWMREHGFRVVHA